MLERGKRYLIKAASGTGKSSLCSFLYGQRGDYSGTISFDDRELTAMQNVEIKNNITHHRDMAQVVQWFEELGIGDKLNTRIDRMSYGQQQRVALIRALCQPFDFLLLDEPISHLDDANSDIMRDIILREADRCGAALIATSIGKHMNIEYDICLNL